MSVSFRAMPERAPQCPVFSRTHMFKGERSVVTAKQLGMEVRGLGGDVCGGANGCEESLT